MRSFIEPETSISSRTGRGRVPRRSRGRLITSPSWRIAAREAARRDRSGRAAAATAAAIAAPPRQARRQRRGAKRRSSLVVVERREAGAPTAPRPPSPPAPASLTSSADQQLAGAAVLLHAHLLVGRASVVARARRRSARGSARRTARRTRSRRSGGGASVAARRLADVSMRAARAASIAGQEGRGLLRRDRRSRARAAAPGRRRTAGRRAGSGGIAVMPQPPG